MRLKWLFMQCLLIKCGKRIYCPRYQILLGQMKFHRWNVIEFCKEKKIIHCGIILTDGCQCGLSNVHWFLVMILRVASFVHYSPDDNGGQKFRFRETPAQCRSHFVHQVLRVATKCTTERAAWSGSEENYGFSTGPCVRMSCTDMEC